MKRSAIIASLIIIAGFLMAVRFSDSTRGYETQGQRHWFVTASGTGTCASWSSPCSFRTAVSKCTDDVQDVIWLGPGDHDTDNGVDATGTTITAKNVRIVGAGNYHDLNSRIMNSAAVVTHVLTVTGHRFHIEGIRFAQKSQPDLDAILLTLSGKRSNITTCQFRSAPGAVADTGIIINNTNEYSYFAHVHFDDFQTVALKTDGCDNLEAKELIFRGNVLGLHVAGGANDHDITISNSEWAENTTAIQTTAGSYNLHFYSPKTVHDTANMINASVYDGIHIFNPTSAHDRMVTYPANAGVTVTAGAGAWAQGNLTQIIPASTITTAFFITGINVQSSTANNIYKLEILYGAATGDNSFGIYEFTDVDRKTAPPPIGILQEMLPANSYVGVKLASDTGGGDTAVITFNYIAF